MKSKGTGKGTGKGNRKSAPVPDNHPLKHGPQPRAEQTGNDYAAARAKYLADSRQIENSYLIIRGW